MTHLETFIKDTKTKGYMDQDKLIAVLNELELRLKALEDRPAAVPYTKPEAH